MKRSQLSALLASGLVVGGGLGPQAALPHAQTTTTVQFDREIVHVLDNHCVMCHADHGPAFALITYEQAYRARWQMRQDVLDRHMAPWAAVAGYGDFVNDNALTQREIDFVTSWAESFGPRNNGEVYTGVAADLAARPPVQAHVDFERWVLGKPDLLLNLSANTVAPRQADAVARTVIALPLKSPRWLQGWEYKPGDRRVVHFVSFSVQETGQWLGSWTPWRGFADLPPGLAYRLPAAAHVIAEIHYYGGQDAIVDRGTLALYFAEAPAPRPVTDIILAPQPANAATPLAQDVNILALQPTLRPGVQSIEVRARTPDGATQVLLYAKDIASQWPTPYVYTRPVPLPKGSELFVVAHYAGATPSASEGIQVLLSIYAGAALPGTASPATPPPPPPASVQRFKLAGTVKSVDAATGRVVIQHGDIPGFMGAMTMSYGVGRREDLSKLGPGDQIRSDVVTRDGEPYLENIAVTRKAP